ncbi:family 43 glycosylhydrolase [Viscerimonas tarda]
MLKNLIVFLFLASAVCAQNVEQTYRNPVIAGDFPDPSVIRVGYDYYAAGTSSDYVPAYPLYHSTDLVNWTFIGHVFDELPSWVAGSCWAPELFYNNGTYYVYYTAKRKGDNVSCIGVASTKDMKAGFQDHGIIIEWGKEAIDAFVFKDDDGKCYISWKAYGLDDSRPIEILASELSKDGLSLVGEHFSLTRHDKGWKGEGDEGQSIVKHKDYYYLLYSVGGCCDNRCNYRVRVARSRDLKSGDWEQYPRPILEGGGLWKCSGHGTPVQTPDGRYFYLYHAYNAYDFEFVGRQGLLDELRWDEQLGWPYFRYGKNPSAQAEMPYKGAVQKNSNILPFLPLIGKQSTLQWDVKLGRPNLSFDASKTTLTPEKGKELAFVGTRPQNGSYTVSVAVFRDQNNFTGLCIYGNKDNYISFGIEKDILIIYRVKQAEKTILFQQQANNCPIINLRAEAKAGRLFRFLWTTDYKTWNSCLDENVDVSFIPQWGGTIHVGMMVSGGSAEYKFVNVFKHE